MNPHLDHRGIFWIPSEEKNDLKGSLKFKGKVGELELFGYFDENAQVFGNSPRRKIPELVGYLEDQIFAIFKDCEIRFSWPQFPTTYVSFKGVFYSNDLDKLKNFGFDRANIKYHFLDSWVQYSAYSPKFINDVPVGVEKNEEPLPIKSLLNTPHFSLELDYFTALPMMEGKKHYKLDQSIFLTIRLKRTAKFKTFQDRIEIIQRFLSFVINRKLSVENPVKLFDGKTAINFRENRDFPKSEERIEYRSSVLFSLNSILEFDPKFQCLKNFIELDKKHEYALRTFCKNIGDQELNDQSKFMNLMYCLDIIEQRENRHKRPQQKTLTPDNRRFINQLKNTYGLQQNEIGKLESKYKTVPKQRLKTKIKRMFQSYKFFFEKIVDEDYVRFVNICVNTRNYYAHENSTTPRIPSDQLSEYNKKLEVLLILFICDKICWPLEKVWIHIRRFDQFTHLK